ncbi:hypothetical protein F511_25213 [Dorcoceras hygrometricum]|uniref:Uncharacterized protein n=1 Tax=Dorcoceras hygrometricum TaxID=472368 RepID=A0A2Z7BF57_9LAMI|nr:hypothetical protein F511_25213 [Dorcoceras hygrometricum]
MIFKSYQICLRCSSGESLSVQEQRAIAAQVLAARNILKSFNKARLLIFLILIFKQGPSLCTAHAFSRHDTLHDVSELLFYAALRTGVLPRCPSGAGLFCLPTCCSGFPGCSAGRGDDPAGDAPGANCFLRRIREQRPVDPAKNGRNFRFVDSCRSFSLLAQSSLQDLQGLARSRSVDTRIPVRRLTSVPIFLRWSKDRGHTSCGESAWSFTLVPSSYGFSEYIDTVLYARDDRDREPPEGSHLGQGASTPGFEPRDRLPGRLPSVVDRPRPHLVRGTGTVFHIVPSSYGFYEYCDAVVYAWDDRDREPLEGSRPSKLIFEVLMGFGALVTLRELQPSRAKLSPRSTEVPLDQERRRPDSNLETDFRAHLPTVVDKPRPHLVRGTGTAFHPRSDSYGFSEYREAFLYARTIATESRTKGSSPVKDRQRPDSNPKIDFQAHLPPVVDRRRPHLVRGTGMELYPHSSSYRFSEYHDVVPYAWDDRDREPSEGAHPGQGGSTPEFQPRDRLPGPSSCIIAPASWFASHFSSSAGCYHSSWIIMLQLISWPPPDYQTTESTLDVSIANSTADSMNTKPTADR